MHGYLTAGRRRLNPKVWRASVTRSPLQWSLIWILEEFDKLSKKLKLWSSSCLTGFYTQRIWYQWKERELFLWLLQDSVIVMCTDIISFNEVWLQTMRKYSEKVVCRLIQWNHYAVQLFFFKRFLKDLLWYLRSLYWITRNLMDLGILSAPEEFEISRSTTDSIGFLHFPRTENVMATLERRFLTRFVIHPGSSIWITTELDSLNVLLRCLRIGRYEFRRYLNDARLHFSTSESMISRLRSGKVFQRDLPSICCSGEKSPLKFFPDYFRCPRGNRKIINLRWPVFALFFSRFSLLIVESSFWVTRIPFTNLYRDTRQSFTCISILKKKRNQA